mmetsp:Transcript_19131/g.31303  ORF Transcript_19131/g.31303 Transcript_19131/m.31303 type:complete len:245 (+) Transcript_19131:105-839(+)
MSTQDVLLKFLVPALGCVSGNAIFLSPMLEVLRIRKGKALGDLNPLPYPLIVSNCIAWVLYSFIVKDWFVFTGNFTGFLLGVFYTVSCRSSPSLNAKTAKIFDILYIGFQGFVLAGGGVALISLKDQPSVAQTVMGVICIFVLVCFYSAPLSTLWHVIRTRNSASLHSGLAITSCVNGSLWTIYGMVMGDIYIWGPNIVGAVFSAFQLFLILILPRARTDVAYEAAYVHQVDKPDDKDLDNLKI